MTAFTVNGEIYNPVDSKVLRHNQICGIAGLKEGSIVTINGIEMTVNSVWKIQAGATVVVTGEPRDTHAHSEACVCS